MAESGVVPCSTKRRARVLVVDDQLSMAEMVADALAERGYYTVALSSSTQAVTRLTEDSFDALVTDLRMPGLDGLELLRISRALDLRRPVIVMTAFSAQGGAPEAIRQGASHYLTKPFKMEDLAQFLRRSLETHDLGGNGAIFSDEVQRC